MEKPWRRAHRRRITLDIPETIYQRMAKQIEKRNITLTKWVTRAIIKEVIQEESYDNPPFDLPK